MSGSDYFQAFESATKRGVNYSVYHSGTGTYTRFRPAEGGGMTTNKELSNRFDRIKQLRIPAILTPFPAC